MKEWKKVKLGEVGKVITGKTPPTKNKDNYGGDIPFITPVDMVGNRSIFSTQRYLTQLGVNSVKNCLLPVNSLCVSCIGSDMGKTVITTSPSITNQQINSLIVNDENYYLFIYYLLRTQEEKIKSLGKNATAVPILNKSKFCEIDLLLPPLPTQHRIASILSRYDALIENYQKQIKLLEEAAARLYKQWFVELKFPGYQNTTIVDGVPEGWEKKKIGEVCNTIGGGTPSTKVASYYEGGKINWVTPTDITRNKCLCLLDTEKKITDEGLKNSSAKMLPAGTILMTSRASVGYFGICDFEVCTNQGFISCIPFEKYHQMYLLFNLMNRVDEIRIKAGGSTYLEISKSVFRNFDIICPTYSIANLFQANVEKIIENVKNLSLQIRHLTESRDRLLPKLMSGELEV